MSTRITSAGLASREYSAEYGLAQERWRIRLRLGHGPNGFGDILDPGEERRLVKDPVVQSHIEAAAIRREKPMHPSVVSHFRPAVAAWRANTRVCSMITGGGLPGQSRSTRMRDRCLGLEPGKRSKHCGIVDAAPGNAVDGAPIPVHGSDVTG